MLSYGELMHDHLVRGKQRQLRIKLMDGLLWRPGILKQNKASKPL